MKLLFAIVLSLLMFGCLMKPVGPFEEGIRPPPGLDVREALTKSEIPVSLGENELNETVTLQSDEPQNPENNTLDLKVDAPLEAK